MGAKRPLKEHELQALRHLAARRGFSSSVDPKTGRFLKNRGLVSQDNDHAPFQITMGGLVEIAKSGRILPYDAMRIAREYVDIQRQARYLLNHMAIRVVFLNEWFDPSRPWELIENLAVLRMSPHLWRNEFDFSAKCILNLIQKWVESELDGEFDLADDRLAGLKSALFEWKFDGAMRLRARIGLDKEPEQKTA